MADRLLPLLLALTVAVPAATRAPCCCQTAAIVGSACCNETACCSEITCPTAETEPPLCCRRATSGNQCCETATGAGGTTLPKGCCGCTECPASRPLDPPPPAAAPPTLKSDTEHATFASLLPPEDARVGQATDPASGDDRLSRPPPDRQAWLCVWTI